MSETELTIPALVALEKAFKNVAAGDIRPSEYVKMKSSCFERMFWIHVSESDEVIDAEITRLTEIGALSPLDVQKIQVARGYRRDAESVHVDEPVLGLDLVGINAAPESITEPPIIPTRVEERAQTVQVPAMESERQAVGYQTPASSQTPTLLFRFTRILLRLAIVAGLGVFGIIGLVVEESFQPTYEETQKKEILKRLNNVPNLPDLNWILGTMGRVSDLSETHNTDVVAKWTTWIDGNFVEVMGDETDKVCARMEELTQLGWLSARRADLKLACEEYTKAERQLSTTIYENKSLIEGRLTEQAYVNAAQRSLENAKRELAFERQGMTLMEGWMHQQIEPGFYGVSEGSRWGEHYVLKTTKTTFTTTGMFSMWVLNGGKTTAVTMAGQQVERVLLIEANTYKMDQAQLRVMEAVRQLDRAEASLRAKNEQAVTPLIGFEQEVARAAARVQELVAKKEVVAPWNSVVPVSEESEIQTFVEAFCGVENAEKRDKSWYCSCPPGAAEPEDELQFLGAWKGAFSSSDSHEVIVRWDGCGGGFNFSQSTGLLRLREGLNWEKVAHNWDLDTSDCQPAELGDRHYLFCQSATSGQGTSEVDVFGVTLKDDGFEFLGVSSFEDHGGTCSYVGDFSTSLEGRLVEDVNADGKPDLVALVSVKRGVYVGGAEPSEDPCEDENNGRVIFETIHRVFARQVGESDSRVYEKADQVQSPGAKKFLESTPAALPSVDAEIAAFWSLDLGSEEVWPIYERRIAAYRNSGDIELAQREIPRISALYPERAENIDLDLAEMCEEFGDYFCASKIYTRLLEATEISGLTFGRAAWFFATAPGPFREVERASQILVKATETGRFNDRAALTRSELMLQKGDVEGAKEFLAAFGGGKKSKLVQEQLLRLETSKAPLERPREVLKASIHRVPQEWRGALPEGDVTGDERLFLAELLAIKARDEGDFARAEAIYVNLAGRAQSVFVRNTFRLGLGKLFEKSGDHSRALKLYEQILVSESERDDRVLNRLAWFLLKVDDAAVKDVKRGYELAQRAAAQTGFLFPNVLDTLAEAQIQLGQFAEARQTLSKCVELDPSREYFRKRLEGLPE